MLPHPNVEALEAVDAAVFASAGPRRLFDLLVEQVTDYAIYVVDPDGRVITWNAGAERIKGYRRDEIIGQPYAIFFPPEDQRAGKPAAILLEARRTGRFQDEGWRVRKEGRRFWASAIVTALRDDDGRLIGFAKITRDLTERLNAEAEARRAAEERAARQQAERHERDVRRSRDELDLILCSIAEGVTVHDTEGKLVFANDAAAHLSGFDSAAEMLASPREKILDRFEIRREDGSAFPAEEFPGQLAFRGISSEAVIRFRQKKTGIERWSYVSAAPVIDPAGKIEFAVSVFREFTERRQSEQAWRFLADAGATLVSSLDYEATLKQLTALAVPHIADWCSVEILGADGNIHQLALAHADPSKLETAHEWRRRWPPRPGSLIRRVLDSGTPELIPEITAEMIRAAPIDEEQKNMTLALNLRSLIVVPLLVSQKPFGVLSFISAESGRRYGQQDLILATAIAQRAALAIENARAYTDARAAVQVRDNFLQIASHELRTPLSALTVLTSSLMRAAEHGQLAQLGAEGLKERFSRAERQVSQLNRLVDRLLDVRRLSSPDLQLDMAEVDLAALAREVIARLDDGAPIERPAIDLHVDGAAVGRWDRGRLDQAMTNLLTNAIKYGGGSPITVTVGAAGQGSAQLSVCDQGPGIAPADQERIFGQFERAATGHRSGLGLGLWLVRRIVVAHGGTVSLESTPGGGACFSIVLPLSPPGDRQS